MYVRITERSLSLIIFIIKNRHTGTVRNTEKPGGKEINILRQVL